MSAAAPSAPGPAGVIRPTVVDDTWLRAAVAEIGRVISSRGGTPLARDEAIALLVPFEARCRLCEAPPIEPGETEGDLTRKLVELGAALSPASFAACQRWLDDHFRRRHDLLGIEGSYEVESGMEMWV